MGCCVSKTRKPDTNKFRTRKADPKWTRPRIPAPARSTVAPPEVETVVKEVLSETPAPKPPVPNPTRAPEEERPVVDVSEFSDISKVPEDEGAGEVRHVGRRSPAKMRSRECFGQTPAINPGPFPERVGSMPSAEGNPMTRECGETSWGQSKLPAVSSGLGRSPSARKTGKFPGQAELEGPNRRIEERPKLEEGSKWISPTAGNELLENPLVSLECFIFL